MGKTSIEWATDVWNPVTGCTKVSQGCRECYAKALHDMRHKAYQEGKRVPEQYATPFEVVQLHPERLEDPLHWRQPKRIFVTSMGDLFHPDVPFEFIDRVYSKMAEADQHKFLILTKRPERMERYYKYKSVTWPLPNVWLGVSVENQQAAEERIPLLLQTPAAVRFVSCEPLLGSVDLWRYLRSDNQCVCCGLDVDKQDGRLNCGCGYCYVCLHRGHDEDHPTNCRGPQHLNWVIVGGESGPNARPMHPNWARILRDQCTSAGVPFFFKQWGEWTSEFPQGLDLSNRAMTYQHGETFYRVGKKLAGNLLDGQVYQQFPIDSLNNPLQE